MQNFLNDLVKNPKLKSLEIVENFLNGKVGIYDKNKNNDKENFEDISDIYSLNGNVNLFKKMFIDFILGNFNNKQ